MRDLDVPIAGRPPGVYTLRVSGGPKSTTPLSATNGEAAYKTVGRTGALPLTPTTRQYALTCPFILVGTQNVMQRRLDCDMLHDPTRLSIFRSSLTE